MIIGLPIYENFELALNCLIRLDKFTPRDIEIYVLDDASKNGFFEDYVASKQIDFARKVVYRRREYNLGFVMNCNLFFQEVKDDVIIINSDVYVGIGWFEAMIRPLEVSSNVATVTAITNQGGLAGIVKVPKDLSDKEKDYLIKEKNTLLSQFIDKSYLLPVGIGHCMLITKKVFDLVGYFDVQFSPGYCEEVDLSIRATRRGLEHHLALTFVHHEGGTSFGKKRLKLQERNDQIIRERYPEYFEIINYFESSSQLSYLRSILNRNSPKSRILIDATLLLENPTGTSRLIQNTISNLDYETFEYTILVARHLLKKYRQTLSQRFEIVDEKILEKFVKTNGKFDLVYIPNQITTQNQLHRAKKYGYKFCFLHLDFISFKNWLYFGSASRFVEYRRIIGDAFQYSSGVGYLSNYVKREAERTFSSVNSISRVVGVGVNHLRVTKNIDFEHKDNLMVVYGAAFAHKNRDFAIRLFNRLSTKFTDLELYLIGPNPEEGSSEHIEESLLQHNEKVKRFPWLSDDDLIKVIARAKLIIYPTSSEGFGFVPFEASFLGTPSVFNLNTSLHESFPNPPYHLTFDLEQDYKTLDMLLSQVHANKKQLQYILSRAKLFSWKTTTSNLETWFKDILLDSKNQSTFHFDSYEMNFKTSSPTFIQRVGAYPIVIYFLPLYTKRRSWVKRRVLMLTTNKQKPKH